MCVKQRVPNQPYTNPLHAHSMQEMSRGEEGLRGGALTLTVVSDFPFPISLLDVPPGVTAPAVIVLTDGLREGRARAELTWTDEAVHQWHTFLTWRINCGLCQSDRGQKRVNMHVIITDK